MPGLRYYHTVDMGHAFGPEYRKLNRNSTRETTATRPRTLKKQSSKSSLLSRSSQQAQGTSGGGDIVGRPYEGYLEQASTTSLGVASEGDYLEASDDEDDDGVKDGTEYMTKTQRRAWRIIQELRQDPTWHGPKYDLLKR